jgi:glutathione synthase/RimK-type ligase-like ATP-grasp enzyme
MANLKIIGKKGSKACKAIRQEASIHGYLGKAKAAPDALINYGLAKPQLEAFYRRYPSARGIPVVNKFVGYSKYNVVRRARDKKISAPESKLSLGKGDKPDRWIEKRTNSIGGKGICLARGKRPISGKYYQEFIKNRRYELRIHAFKWIPQEEWRIQKRLGKDDEIAWNYKNGGHFVTVKKPRSYKTFIEAAEVADQILDMLGMSFGAVDFLIDKDYKLYFIEINSAPGFTELSKPIYVDAFNKLKALSAKQIRKYT